MSDNKHKEDMEFLRKLGCKDVSITYSDTMPIKEEMALYNDSMQTKEGEFQIIKFKIAKDELNATKKDEIV